MSWSGAIVTYAVLFFVCLLVILPRGVPTQDEDGEIEPGTPAGAPSEINIRRKYLWAALMALAGFAVIAVVMESGWLSLDDFDFLFPASFHERLK